MVCDSLTTGPNHPHGGGSTPILSKSTTEPPMVTDTTQDAQIRHTIRKAVLDMDLRLLQRIAYEVRCEEMWIRPDSWQLFPLED
jgi:hypothetical protein